LKKRYPLITAQEVTNKTVDPALPLRVVFFYRCRWVAPPVGGRLTIFIFSRASWSLSASDSFVAIVRQLIWVIISAENLSKDKPPLKSLYKNTNFF
jgi:hypothetical protein